MNKIVNIVNYIKNNSNINYIELKLYVEEQLENDIQKNIYYENDADFLLNLVLDNIYLSTDILVDIFINSKNTIEDNVLGEKTNLENTEYQSINSKLYTYFLNIFTGFGNVTIHPKNVILLWNDKSLNNINNIFKVDEHDKVINNKYTSITIKYIDFKLLNNDISKQQISEMNSAMFNNFTRKFGLPNYTNGFYCKYNINLKVNNFIIMTTVETFYKGLMEINFYNKKKGFKIESADDFYKIVDFYKEEMLDLFTKNNCLFIKNLCVLYECEVFQPFASYFPLCLNKDIFCPRIEAIKQIYYYDEDDNDQDSKLVPREICTHEVILDTFIEDQKNYFNEINDFIEKYVMFNESSAYCKICFAMINSLNIQGDVYVDNKKYLANFKEDIFDLPPYNSFNNARLYFENVFYLFTYYTQIHILDNREYISRLSLDNFIYFYHNRLDFEIKYKENVLLDEIFFLRITSNFFSTRNEKEKFQEQKVSFSHILILINVLILTPMSFYNEFFFARKLVNIDNLIHDTESNISFEDIMTKIINFYFIRTKIEYYSKYAAKNKIKKLYKTIKIYREIMTEESSIIYDYKKNNIEKFFISKKNNQDNHLHIYENVSYRDDLLQTLRYTQDMLLLERALNDKDLPEKQLVIPNSNSNYKKNTMQHHEFKSVFKCDFYNSDISNNENIIMLNQLIKEYLELLQINSYVYNNNVYQLKKMEIDCVNTYLVLFNNNNKLILDASDFFTLKFYNQSKEMQFFMLNDICLEDNEITNDKFTEIMLNYITFISSLFNIEINHNLQIFLLKNTNISNTRKEIFIMKIYLFSEICAFLNVKNKNDIYENTMEYNII